MKTTFLVAALSLFTLVSNGLVAQNKTASGSGKATSTDGINWMTLEEAEKLNAKSKTKKKVFVDVYTDWCGWCKRLDATTYKDPAVVKYLNDNFYSVKLNAETRDTITFKGTKHAFNPSQRKNTAASYFMPPSGGGYPTLTYLDGDFKVLRIAPGYANGEDMLKQLKYINENYYLNMPYEKYVAQAAEAPAPGK